jgi:aminopeptidase N
MKTDTPRPILLKDYRPPSYLISHVQLDVTLHPTQTRVRARSKVRPNTAVAKPGPLKLDGELLELESVAINGRALDPKHYRKNDRDLVIPKPPAGGSGRIRRSGPALRGRHPLPEILWHHDGRCPVFRCGGAPQGRDQPQP